MTAGTSLRALAYHTAAHAVANVALGLRVETVTIIPGDGYEGVCTGPSIWELLDGSDPEGSRGALGNLVLATLAGPRAERRLTGQAETDPGCGDSERVRVILRRYLPRLSLETAEARTDSFLLAHWRHIESVADALLERKTLTGVDVAALIRQTR